MKFTLIVFFFAVVAVSAVNSVSFTDLSKNGPQIYVEDVGEAVRQRRVTCDLLTVGGMIGDSACTANCLSMGKVGGRCNDGVCQCCQTTFKELWNQHSGSQ